MTISSTENDMLVQFTTDDYAVNKGFKAYFHYIPIEPNCVNWLDTTTKDLKSPVNPKINCSWVITAPSADSTIVVNFETFDVKCFQLQIFCILIYLTNIYLTFVSLDIMI